MKKNTNIFTQIPVITLRGVVIYPDNKMQFDIIRPQSIAALQAAMKKNQKIFFVTQKNLADEQPTSDEIYDVGVIATIAQVIKNDDGSIKILIETDYKCKINKLYTNKSFFEADIEIIESVEYKQTNKLEALIHTANDLLSQYCSLLDNIPEEVLFNTLAFNHDPIFTAEYIAANTNIDVDTKQKILAENNPIKKLEILVSALSHHLDIMFIEKDILKKLHKKIDKNQREYYLREQLKLINEELGEDSPDEEKSKYKSKISSLDLKDKDVEKKLLEEAERLSKIPSSSPDASVIKTYLDTCINLPWHKKTKDKINITSAKQALDKEHYGLNNVKERIIELLAVKKLNPDVRGQILCLCGPPGVGKTSIVKSIAKTIGRKYVKISLGGVKDESEIRGHRKTYIGAMPGRIINALNTSGVKNPLILLDEIDKMSSTFNGDPASAMLEVLDAEQNSQFTDHYVEIPFDLSDVMFIATANDKYEIPAPLLDRMEIIEVTSYTETEKLNIAKKHLLNKQIMLNGLTNKDVKFNDDAFLDIINHYTAEAGVRNLERNIAKILRKVAQNKINNDNFKKITISSKNIENYLGPKKFKPDRLLENDEVGTATGLAWTSIGGEIMHIEVSVLNGSGQIELTGNLGNVMKESAKASISYVRSKAQEFGIDADFHKTKDIHIHVPEGAVPKDGPSAGVTICTALVSELTKISIKKDVAMTGEITLRGRVLPIGGLKEKTMAAYKSGIKTVLIPKENASDLHEIDPVVKNSINFVTVTKIDEVLCTALTKPIK